MAGRLLLALGNLRSEGTVRLVLGTLCPAPDPRRSLDAPFYGRDGVGDGAKRSLSRDALYPFADLDRWAEAISVLNKIGHGRQQSL